MRFPRRAETPWIVAPGFEGADQQFQRLPSGVEQKIDDPKHAVDFNAHLAGALPQEPIAGQEHRIVMPGRGDNTKTVIRGPAAPLGLNRQRRAYSVRRQVESFEAAIIQKVPFLGREFQKLRSAHRIRDHKAVRQ